MIDFISFHDLSAACTQKKARTPQGIRAYLRATVKRLPKLWKASSVASRLVGFKGKVPALVYSSEHPSPT